MRTQPRTFSVNGTVRDAVTHAQLPNVKVELQAFGGAVVATVFTTGNGGFAINDVNEGSYTLVANQVGFQIATSGVDVRETPVYGIQIELLRPPDADTMIPGTVSERELSIPHNAHEDMQKGVELLYGKSDYQGALKEFEKAIQEYPDYYEAYTQMGIAYMKVGDPGDSEKTFRKAIEVSKESYPAAYIGLAEIYLDGGRFSDAEPLSRKASEIDAQSWRANLQLSRELLGLHRPAEAETCAVAAVVLKPDNPELFLVLANVHIQLQNRRALLDDLNRYLQLAPTGSFAEQARRLYDQTQQELAASQRSPAVSPEIEVQGPSLQDK